MAAPTFDLRVKGEFSRAFIVPSVPVGALTERVALLVQADESGKAVGFKMATCGIFLLDDKGNKHLLVDDAVFPTLAPPAAGIAAPPAAGISTPPAAGTIVNVWIETPAPAPSAGGAAAGGAAPGVKRARSVVFDVPPPGTVITVRDFEAKHKSVTIAVPVSWEALQELLQKKIFYSDSHRLYYSTTGLIPEKKKLVSEADFVEYARILATDGCLPDLWILKTAAMPSPEDLPAAEAAAGTKRSGSGASSSGRSSAVQTAFREALITRDASGSGVVCALCGTDSDVQAAHILPRKGKDQFTREEGLADAMDAAELVTLYDPRNGFLLCDQCHDFFDAFLWSVDSERKVVVSSALAANVPSLAVFAGKQLFPDDEAASRKSRNNRPLPGVWAWHFQAYQKTTAARHAKAALGLVFCSRCKKPYVLEWRKDEHEATCTAAGVPAKHFFTPARKLERGAGAGASAGPGEEM